MAIGTEMQRTISIFVLLICLSNCNWLTSYMAKIHLLKKGDKPKPTIFSVQYPSISDFRFGCINRCRRCRRRCCAMILMKVVLWWWWSQYWIGHIVLLVLLVLIDDAKCKRMDEPDSVCTLSPMNRCRVMLCKHCLIFLLFCFFVVCRISAGRQACVIRMA